MEYIGHSELCHSWCRLCLKQDVVNLNLFGQTCCEKQIAMKLNTCFPLKISENDDKRTHNICILCLLTLEATYELRQKAIRSDKMLRALLDRNQHKLPTVVQPSTEMTPPEQMKIPQISVHTAGKENQPIQFTTLHPIENMENFQSLDKEKQSKLRIKKLKPMNKLVDSQSHEHLNTTIIRNNKTFAQTPFSMKQQESEQISVLIRSPVPSSTAVQRKISRERLAGINADNNEELPSNDSFKPMNQASVPMTPKRNTISQKLRIPPNTSEKCKDLYKQSKTLQSDTGNTLTTNSLVLGKVPRIPLTEKVSLKENYSMINVQTPKTKQNDKNSVKTDFTITPIDKQTNIFTAEKKRKREPTQLSLENESAEVKMRKNLEPCNVTEGNSKTKNVQGTIDKCIDKSRAQMRTQTPTKLRLAEELAKKTKNHHMKMKKLDRDEATSANKANRDIYEFTDNSMMESSPSYTSYAKQTAKRTTLFNHSVLYFETRPAQINNDRVLGTEKKPRQDKLLSCKDRSTPSPSNNEGSDSSLGTLLKDIPSSQSEEQPTPVKSLTKLLPEDIRDSWKKASGTWASENISNESEDPFNYGDLGTCMATGDIFGASIIRKMSNRNAKNDKLEECAKQKINVVKKKETTRGISTITSPLSALSSSDGPPKSSISSLNLSSGDDSPKKYNMRNTPIIQNPMTVSKTTVNPKSIVAKQASSKSPMKPHNLQAIGGNSEGNIPSKESCQSDSSSFTLTPEFARRGKH